MTQVTITKGTVTFTFLDAMIDRVGSTIGADVDETIMPGAGPMSNIGNDFNGVNKQITVSGVLLNATSSVTTGAGAPTITQIEHMKYWLEGLGNGIQNAFTFTSNYESYSLESSSGSTTINGVAIPGTWKATKAYVKNLTFDEEQANPDSCPFSLTLFVAGI